ncbi:THUMP-like domain-containing protein [Bifidobacterium biavatii]|uniref:Methyltransferase n=2 Tax=Bifidobacterium biavatii TaxID=762212 RepID=A0A087A098_9BIFI|nr:Methyltransferase [Bifidobacterium biavatii DSM 23969]
MSPETARFAAEHRNEDVRELALKAKRTDELDLPMALDQIAGWQTARTKLPQWAACEDIIYPPHISMEQCSSEFTAQYKAEVARRVVQDSECRRCVDNANAAAREPGEAAGGNASDDAADNGVDRVQQEAACPGTMIDLTGGFGVDFSYIARGFERAIYVERQKHLCELAEHNMRALGLEHVMIVNDDAETVLGELATVASASAQLAGMIVDVANRRRSPSQPAADSPTAIEDRLCLRSVGSTVVEPSPRNAVGVSLTAQPSRGGRGSASILDKTAAALIFIDPARRDAHGGRTVAIEDCTPNVLALRDRLLAAAPHVMIKLSPMLDWRKAVADFRGAVGEVHIVSTGNECKELLLVLNRETNTTVHVCCVNDGDRLDYVIPGDFAVGDAGFESGLSLRKDFSTPLRSARNDTGKVAGFARNDGGKAVSSRSLGRTPLPETITYLYEPNASIMKAGCFALVEERYGVTQIGPNSHLFVSGEARPIADFPGRAFAVETVTGMGKKELKQALANLAKANIAVRNFPLTAVQLRKKLRLNDGGDTYLFATTLAGAKHVILRCRRL